MGLRALGLKGLRAYGVMKQYLKYWCSLDYPGDPYNKTPAVLLHGDYFCVLMNSKFFVSSVVFCYVHRHPTTDYC